MRTYRVSSQAKVNLTLHVLGRRDDGYHEISSLMVPISLADRLEIQLGGSGAEVEVPGHPSLEGPGNLCVRAWEAFNLAFSTEMGARVRLEKRIPIAAGLGGGSSNAAALLRCMAEEAGIPLADPRLAEVALEVGSDVPFFLRGVPALVGGRGEVLQPAPDLPPVPMVLVKPSFGVSAKEAYETLSSLRAQGRGAPSPEAPLPPLPDPAAVAAILHNDLQEAVRTLHPIDGLLHELLAAGALGALMSGSGPCVFGVFPTAEEAERGAASIRGLPGRVVSVVTSGDAHATLETP